MIEVGSDFSGVGSFIQALQRLEIEHKEVFACDINKYARQVYAMNFGEPDYFPSDVYERDIPAKSLDIFVTSPPCFVGETLINTSLGFKKIKDVKIGDFVLTHENRYQKVTDFGSKISDIVTLKAQGIVETKTTASHRYFVREKKYIYGRENDKKFCKRVFSEPKWVEAKDLTKNHFIGINIPNISENKREITKETAYVLGRYVADGWIRDRNDENGKTKGNAVVLAIGKDKIDYISEKIKLKHSLGKEVNGVSKLFIYSNSLVQLINDLQLGFGAINKRIPQEIINLPNNVLQSFVDGYMDGDGHSHKDFFRATSVSKELLMGLQLCIAKLYKVNANIKFTKTPDTTIIQGRTVNQRDYYVLEFRKEMRKQSNAVVIKDKIWYPVREISFQKEKELVFDITVEKDNSFTANQAIVHNCQSFSLAGKRKGEDDKRGILFYNSHEFIKKNNPRYFIFENVKGLLSDDKKNKDDEYGNTFNKWITYLGGKSVNGKPIIFPHEESVPYHIYFQVLNAKNYGIPQNRERIFIIGIRDDIDNSFSFPKHIFLEKRLKDVLEKEVDEKYFLSDKTIEYITKRVGIYTDINPEVSRTVCAQYSQSVNGSFVKLECKFGLYTCCNLGIMCLDCEDGCNYEILENPKQIQIGTWMTYEDGRGFRPTEDNNCPTILARAREDGSGQPVVKLAPEVYQLNPSTESGGKQPYQHNRVYSTEGVMTTLDTGSARKSVLIPANNSKGYDIAREGEDSINFSNPNSKTRRGRIGKGVAQTLDTGCEQGILNQQRIRRLTVREVFRLMDFNEDFIEKTINSKLISDSQLYKMAGNSICVGVLVALIEKLNLKP